MSLFVFGEEEEELLTAASQNHGYLPYENIAQHYGQETPNTVRSYPHIVGDFLMGFMLSCF